jgi:hypothetical protein
MKYSPSVSKEYLFEPRWLIACVSLPSISDKYFAYIYFTFLFSKINNNQKENI